MNPWPKDCSFLRAEPLVVAAAAVAAGIWEVSHRHTLTYTLYLSEAFINRYRA